MTLTARIINLILAGTLPQNILAITFTNKAATEMRERILKAIKNNSQINFPTLENNFIPFISTFHSLGVYIIRENYQILKISKYFSIYDRADQKKAVKEALNILDLDPKEWEAKNIISFISKNKGNFIDWEKFSRTAGGNLYIETMSKIWGEYEKIKNKDKALDFDDLLLESAKLLEENKKVREHFLQKWTHLHIDEYQDTNRVQYKLAKLLTNPQSENIFAVGDDDQAIYGWRNSDIKNILNFEKEFKNVQKIFMEQNYRSTKNIIEASNAVIAKNETRYPKKLFTTAESGDKIVLYNAFSEKEEARYIAEECQEILKNWKKNKVEKNENDIAVLYRANFQSRVLEEAFLKAGLSYQVLGTKFFDRAEVKDIIAYIRVAKNPDSLIDLKRIINSPKRGIGKSSVVKIFAENGSEVKLPPQAQRGYLAFQEILKNINNFIDQNPKMSELVKFVIEESGFYKNLTEKKTEEDLERLSNIYELATFAEKYDYYENIDEALEIFLEEVALMSDADSNSEEKNKKKPAIKLMTIHSAKGLEFETVFVSGVEDHFFSPNSELDKKKEAEKLEEERRLFYVAMTRAKKKLYLTWAGMRNIYGRTEINNICDFVLDIPEKYLEEKENFGNNNEEVVYLEW